jgi:hypothetical protein
MKRIFYKKGMWLSMKKYQKLNTDFWKYEMKMTLEEKYFYFYLLTNSQTTHIGIYQLTKKQIAFELGYSLDIVHLLMERFIKHYKLICYNPKSRELALINWGRYIEYKGGKQVMNCIYSELKRSRIHHLFYLFWNPSINKKFVGFTKFFVSLGRSLPY